MSKNNQLNKFERDLIKSFKQAIDGIYSLTHTPAAINERRKQLICTKASNEVTTDSVELRDI